MKSKIIICFCKGILKSLLCCGLVIATILFAVTTRIFCNYLVQQVCLPLPSFHYYNKHTDQC